MSTETGRVELSFTSDQRLLAGVSGAVNHVAEAAGLAESPRAELVAAVEDACQEALNEIANHKEQLTLSVDVVGDRIEVDLEFKPSGAAPKTADAKGTASRHKLDSVRREMKGDRARVTLLKKISQ